MQITPNNLSNRKRLSFLLNDSILYGGAAAISKAFSLITFPLLARHFSLVEYGVLDYFLVLAGFLATFFIFGQDSAVARYFYEYEETSVRKQLISQSLMFQLVGLLVFLPLLWFSSGWLTSFLIKTREAEWFFKIVLLQLPFLLLINFSRNLLKWTFSRARFLTMSLGFTVVQASMLVLAVVKFDIGIRGVLLVTLFTSSVFGILGLYFVRVWLEIPRDFRRLKEMLPYAVPLGVICVLGAFSPTLERTLTNQLLGVEELGLYAAGTKIAMLMGLVVTAFQTAWGPFSLSIYKQADAAHTYNWVLKIFALGVCVVVFVLSMVAQPVIHFLASDRYAGAMVVVFPLSMGLAIQATSWITEIGIGIAKRSYLNLYAYLFFIGGTLGGIFLLAPVLGLMGVGLGVLIGHAVRAITSSCLAQRAYPMSWQYRPAVNMLGFTLFWGLGAVLSGRILGPVAYISILLIGLLALLFFSWLFLFTRFEKQRFKELASLKLTALFSRKR
jgi:O-antigen/teichoic acid export membrane protein